MPMHALVPRDLHDERSIEASDGESYLGASHAAFTPAHGLILRFVERPCAA